MRVKLLASLLVLSGFAIQSQAAMMAYLTIKGQKQGIFTGSVTQKGREGKIAVIGVEHDIMSPRNAATGLPTGKRMHKPFVVTIELDKATPLIYNALSTNENLPEVTLEFWTPQNKGVVGVGVEVQHYTVKLTNASISDVHFHMQNIRNPELVKYPESLDISFTYQKVEWIWKDGGIIASDDWNG